MRILTVLTLFALTSPAAAQEPGKCWDKRIQLWAPCSNLAKDDPLLPGKECWHADYQSFDTCDAASFNPNYHHAQTPREKCQELGLQLNWSTGKCS
jgi:hypothetical protein